MHCGGGGGGGGGFPTCTLLLSLSLRYIYPLQQPSFPFTEPGPAVGHKTNPTLQGAPHHVIPRHYLQTPRTLPSPQLLQRILGAPVLSGGFSASCECRLGHCLRRGATLFSEMALIQATKAGQLSLWWLFPAVPRVPGVA